MPRPNALSGRFVLRIEPDLHARLRRQAVEEGTSLNDLCARRLAEPERTVPDPLRQVMIRAASLFGPDLAGVVAFGSWARGEMTDGSDVDVLIVLGASIPPARDLYRRWDAEPMHWNGRPIEPRFANVPPTGSPAEGLWAEIALDGIVLFERGIALSLLLVQVRREIASGRLVRKVVHGQPYWVRDEVA